MREVIAVDGAANCTPSSHVFYAVLAALLVGRGAKRWTTRSAVWVLAVAVSATTITTGQHYFIDVPCGAAAALVGYGAAVALGSAGWPRASSPGPDCAQR
jgi:membrane-associated phospholipid phosphatase